MFEFHGSPYLVLESLRHSCEMNGIAIYLCFEPFTVITHFKLLMMGFGYAC